MGNIAIAKPKMLVNVDFPPKQDFKHQYEAVGHTHDFRTQHPKIDQVYLFYKLYHRESLRRVKQQFPAKTRLKAQPTLCIPTIFELSAPKLTKFTWFHKLPCRGTIPPFSAWSICTGGMIVMQQFENVLMSLHLFKKYSINIKFIASWFLNQLVQ